jgi:2-dehydro-3-deoxygluconokinase
VSGVLALGETMAAFRSGRPLRLGGELQLSIAGSESNVAIGVARLGWPARWVGVVGGDEFGALVVRSLRAEGVDTSAVRVNPDAPTGLIFFEQRLEGVVRVTYRRKASAGSTLCPADVERGFAGGVDLVVVSGITPALGAEPRAAAQRAVALARQASLPVVLDVNFRPTLWSAAEAREVLCELAASVDVVVASEDELSLVAPHACEQGGVDRTTGLEGGGATGGGPDRAPGDGPEPPDAGSLEQAQVAALLASGRREVLVKRAGAGASLFSRDGAWHQPPMSVVAVDTVGAGDAFVAGYLTALLERLGPGERLARAATCGAFAVASRGDWEGLPRADELALLELPPGSAQR